MDNNDNQKAVIKVSIRKILKSQKKALKGILRIRNLVMKQKYRISSYCNLLGSSEGKVMQDDLMNIEMLLNDIEERTCHTGEFFAHDIFDAERDPDSRKAN